MTSGEASHGECLQTKEMIGNLRAAHYHRYELPLLSAPGRFLKRSRCPRIPTLSVCCWGRLLLESDVAELSRPTTRNLAEAMQQRVIPGIVVRTKSPDSGVDYVLVERTGQRGDTNGQERRSPRQCESLGLARDKVGRPSLSRGEYLAQYARGPGRRSPGAGRHRRWPGQLSRAGRAESSSRNVRRTSSAATT